MNDAGLRLWFRQVYRTVGRRVPVDVLAIADRLRMEVSVATFERPDISGAIQCFTSGRAHIWINRFDAPTRQRFTIAHEIGHSVLHLQAGDAFSEPEALIDADLTAFRTETPPATSVDYEREREANAFAAALLMPRPLLQETLLRRPRSSDAMAALFQVSTTAMTIRLRNLGLCPA